MDMINRGGTQSELWTTTADCTIPSATIGDWAKWTSTINPATIDLFNLPKDESVSEINELKTRVEQLENALYEIRNMLNDTYFRSLIEDKQENKK